MTLAWGLLFKLMPSEDRGAIAGLATTTKGIGLIVGTLLAGILIDVLQPYLPETDGLPGALADPRRPDPARRSPRRLADRPGAGVCRIHSWLIGSPAVLRGGHSNRRRRHMTNRTKTDRRDRRPGRDARDRRRSWRRGRRRSARQRAGRPSSNDAAKRLDVTPAQLQAALQGAYDARIDAAVAAGKITKEQAEAMKQRSAEGGLPLFGGGHHGGSRPSSRRPRRRSPPPHLPRPDARRSSRRSSSRASPSPRSRRRRASRSTASRRRSRPRCRRSSTRPSRPGSSRRPRPTRCRRG